jgi:hypothetical protein
MLGVKINPMLDFGDHLKHITTEVRQLARVLATRQLSPNRKQLVLDHILKSKYHATHLGIFTDTQLHTIAKILNKAARNALGYTPSFRTEAMHRPTKEMGLGYDPLNDKSTQMGIEHLMETLIKPTYRGFLAYAHTTRVAITPKSRQSRQSRQNPQCPGPIIHLAHPRSGTRPNTQHAST